MKHVLFLFTVLLILTFNAQAQQQTRTLKTEMEVIHEHFGMNFIYDSSLELTVLYAGKPMSEIIRSRKSVSEEALNECLKSLFKESGIKYEVMKKYIVLTRADSKKKPRDYTIFIEEQFDTINESVVTAMVDPRRNSTQTGLKRIDNKDLNSGFAFFSTPDVIKTLQMMPGVSSGTELLSGFYVHGGDGSDNLFLLDGVPIYSVSHLLGLFSSFNTDVISSMDFYKSGFPARYGSKMSSIVDVTTKDGDFKDYHGTFAIGLIDGRFQLEGPLWKDKTSFNVGLRRTWTETVTIPVLAVVNKINKQDHFKQNVRYAFTDLNARITHKFSETNRLTANFYTGRDVVKYMQDRTWKDRVGVDMQKRDERNMTNISLSWGNVLGSLNWSYDINERMSMRNLLYYSGSLSNFTFYTREINKDNSYKNSDIKNGLYNNSNVHNMGFKSDWFHAVTPNQKLRYGMTAQYHIYGPDATSKSEVEADGVKYTGIAYADSLRYHTAEAAAYIEDEIAFTESFSVNAGLRYSLFRSAGMTWHSVEPRIALKYSLDENISFKASYTEMSQPSHLVSSIYLDLPTNSWLPSTSKIRPSRSREAAGGVYTNLDHNMHLNVEGWYKHMYNLLEYAGSYALFPPITGWEDCYRSGNGRSWGAEIDFGYNNGKTEANVYYTLSWSQRKFDDFYPDWYRDRNDNRHKLTIMARHKFGKRFELYGAWNYHSGNRVTMATHQNGYMQIFSEPNNVKLPDYHRLDLGFNFVKNTKRGNTSIWNLSVYNAYCRTNPISADVSVDWVDREEVSFYGNALGIIPIIPTFSYTLKF